MQSGLLTMVGASIIGAAVALKFFTSASDFLIIAIAVIGGVTIPGTHVVSALRAWSGKQ